MFTINGQDWELPQSGKEPTMGYSDEFIEKTMISGKIRRIYRGRRFYASFYYPYLSESQKTALEDLFTTQRQSGSLSVSIDSPYGTWSGEAILDGNNNQRRFTADPKTGERRWLDWTISITAVDYDN